MPFVTVSSPNPEMIDDFIDGAVLNIQNFGTGFGTAFLQAVTTSLVDQGFNVEIQANAEITAIAGTRFTWLKLQDTSGDPDMCASLCISTQDPNKDLELNQFELDWFRRTVYVSAQFDQDIIT